MSIKDLTERVQEFRKLISEYCRLESVAAHNRMMNETADWAENLLKETGFDTRQIEVDGAPNFVFGYMKGRSDFTLLFYNHYDVQPETPIELWESPPFEVTERDGKLFARGISDNKSEFISRICAIRSILASEGELPVNIKWILEGEEEIGSVHFGDLTKEHGTLLKADGALWEGGGFTEKKKANVLLGFRGLLYVELHTEAMNMDAHSGAAQYLPSGAWKLLKAISCIKDEKGNIIIPGFFDGIREPNESEKQSMRDNVDLEMEKKILAMYGLDSFIGNKTGYDLESSVYEPTANIAGFLTGYTEKGVKTVLPAKAMAKMDFRLVPEQNPDDILEKLRNHFNTNGFEDVQATKLGGAEPVVISIDDPFVQRVMKIGRDFTGLDAEITPLGGGTLPLLEAMKKNVGMLGVSTSGNPVYYGSGPHSPNEHIRLDDIPRAIEFNVFLLTELGRNQTT